MDDSSEGLAPLRLRGLGRVLGDLKTVGAAIVLVEQNVAFALRVADCVYVLSRRRIAHGCRAEEMSRADALKARYLGV